MNNGSLSDISKIIGSETIKIVSFDLFDTLIVRPGSPRDILKLCALVNDTSFEKYMQLRNWNSEWWSNDDFGIPDIIGSSDQRNKYRDMEFQIEYDLIRPRKYAVELLNSAIKQGKKIAIVTDMYLTKQMIKQLMKKNGITYDYLYISDKTKSKKNGRLWEHILNDFKKEGVEANQIVHIGDNKKADYEQPTSKGINAIYLPSPLDCFKNSKLNSILSPITLGDKFTVGTLINLLFDDPTTDYEGFANGLLKNLALMLGAFFFNYTCWMINEMKMRNEDLLLLNMRDGDIIKHILPTISKYVNVPTYEELYLNRLIRAPTLFKNEGIFENYVLGTEYYATEDCFVKEYRRESMSIIEKCKKEGKCEDKDIIFLNKALDQQYLTAKQEILNQYLMDVTKGKYNIALFDVGYHATALKYLNKYWDVKRIHEYQVLGTPEQINVSNYIVQKKIREVIPLDSIVKSIHRYKSIEKNGDKYELVPIGLEKINVVTEYIQEIIVEYCEYFSSIFKEHISNLSFSNELIWSALKEMSKGDYGDLPVFVSFNENRLPADDVPIAKELFSRKESDGVSHVCLARIMIAETQTDQDIIIKHFEKSIQLGINVSINELFDYVWSNKIEKYYETVKCYVEKLANYGDKNALGRLGKAYHYGKGVKADFKISLDLLKQAADSDIIWIRNELFDLLWDIGDENNDELMIETIRPIALIGNGNALGRLGKAYHYGKGVNKDYNMARKYYTMASDKGIKWVKKLLTALNE